MLSTGDGRQAFLGGDRQRSAPGWTPELGAMLVALVVLLALVF